MRVENLYAEFKPTIWHRLGFKQAHAPYDDEFRDDEFIVNATTVVLGVRDRFRVLLTGALRVETRTYTKAPVEVVKTTSGVGIIPRRWLARP